MVNRLRNAFSFRNAFSLRNSFSPRNAFSSFSGTHFVQIVRNMIVSAAQSSKTYKYRFCVGIYYFSHTSQFVNAGDRFTVVGRARIKMPAKNSSAYEDGWVDGGTVVEAMQRSTRTTGSFGGMATTRNAPPSAEWPLGKPVDVIVKIKAHQQFPDGSVMWLRNLNANRN